MRTALLCVLLISGLLTSCKKEEENDLRLIASANAENYSHFFVNISGVQIHLQTEDGKSLYYMLDTKSGLFDLATDSEILISSKNDLPQGEVKSLKLIIKEGSYFEKDGVKHEFEKNGSETQVELNKELIESTDLRLNFEIEKSIVARERGYQLKPVFSVN